jgi:hypothetical protein
MSRRTALLLRIRPQSGVTSARLSISNSETQEDVVLGWLTLAVTLECEAGATYASGYLHLVEENARFPLHTNAAFYDALDRYLTTARPDA